MHDEQQTSTPRCRSCRYSLSGLSKGHCPECGRWFDTSIAESLYRRKFRVRGWVFRVTALACCVYACLFLLAACASSRMYGGGFLEFVQLLGACCLVVVMPIWILVSAGWLLEGGWNDPRTVKRVWIATPLCAVFALLVLTFNVPDRVRLMISSSALIAAVTAELANPTSPGSRTIGVVHTRGTFVRDGVVHLWTGSRYLSMDSRGIAYIPSGPVGKRYRRLYGSWYLFFEQY